MDGNFDVYVMPSAGGESKRLTFHSNGETPWTFSADDKAVLFSAYRQDVVTSVQLPTRMMDELYRIPVAGGRVVQVLPVPARNATLNSTGDRLIYHDIKGYESDWRKQHTSAVTRDIWTYGFKTGRYAQLTSFSGEDRNPVWGANDDTFFYLSEQNGSFNVYESALSRPEQTTPLTRFSRHPVRLLTRARDNTLCFGYDGEIYTLRPGGEPQKVPVRIAVDGRASLNRVVPVNDGFTEMTLAPGREGVRLRVPRGDLRECRGRGSHQADHRHAVAGAQRAIQLRRLQPGVCRGGRQQLERLLGLVAVSGKARFKI